MVESSKFFQAKFAEVRCSVVLTDNQSADKYAFGSGRLGVEQGGTSLREHELVIKTKPVLGFPTSHLIAWEDRPFYGLNLRKQHTVFACCFILYADTCKVNS